MNRLHLLGCPNQASVLAASIMLATVVSRCGVRIPILRINSRDFQVLSYSMHWLDGVRLKRTDLRKPQGVLQPENTFESTSKARIIEKPPKSLLLIGCVASRYWQYYGSDRVFAYYKCVELAIAVGRNFASAMTAKSSRRKKR